MVIFGSIEEVDEMNHISGGYGDGDGYGYGFGYADGSGEGEGDGDYNIEDFN